MNKEKQLISQVKEFIKTAKNPLIVILGVTAAGKTKTSLNIAKAIKGEIISTDSRQIYQEMPIATDVISNDQQQGIAHHMLEIASPEQTITLAEYKDMALKIIDQIYQRNHIPMLVGGTGLYISAIIEGYEVPRIRPNLALREKLQKQAENEGKESVHNLLKKLDPKTAKTIHANNLRYVIRAIEIAKSPKKRLDKKKPSPFNTFLIGINRPRKEIYSRINARVDQQEERGLIEEVRSLVDKGYAEHLPSMTSLGVKEIIPYIKGEMELSECLEILKKNTRHYAKRQYTWLKRYKNVHWYEPE